MQREGTRKYDDEGGHEKVMVERTGSALMRRERSRAADDKGSSVLTAEVQRDGARERGPNKCRGSIQSFYMQEQWQREAGSRERGHSHSETGGGGLLKHRCRRRPLHVILGDRILGHQVQESTSMRGEEKRSSR